MVLTFISKFIPINYLKIALIAAVFIFGSFSGYKLASWHYSPLLEKAEYQLQVCNENYSTIKGISDKQNKAILELNTAKEKKEAEVNIAQDKAKQLSQINSKQAQDILRLQLGNRDACQAASALVDEELVRERNHAKN